MTFFIYITSLIYLFWMPSHVEINSVAQLLMIFRAMRPLRIYTLVPHIRRVVVELCKRIPRDFACNDFVNRTYVHLRELWGTNCWKTALVSLNKRFLSQEWKCMVKMMITCIQRSWCRVSGRTHETSTLTILEMLCWPFLRRYRIRDGTSFVIFYIYDKERGRSFFIHIYVFIGCMIGLTLFVGVVIANYTENRGTALLTVDQRRWHDLKARLKMAQPLHVPPKPAESARLRIYLYELTLSRPFKQAFALLVVINSFTLVVPWNVEEEKQRSSVLFVLTIYYLEKDSIHTKGFWQSRRNRSDFFITVLGLAWIILHFIFQVPAHLAGGKDTETEWRRFSYTFGYIVVILRFFTIAGRKSTLKMLMQTVLMSMVRSMFIIAAMFLLVLFYAYTANM
ncbi:unnamed protein product, partial [Mesorhabditis spiculigera]